MLFMELLSHMLIKAFEMGLVKGLRVGARGQIWTFTLALWG